MKKFLPTLLLTCAAFSPVALTASTFEGKIHMQMSSAKQKDGPQEMDYEIKEDFMRIDIPVKDKSGKQGAVTPGMIMDMKKQEMLILIPQQQMYMVQSMKGQGQPGTPAAAVQHEAADKAADMSLEKTGEHEKILGYDCEKFLIKTKDGSHALWLTSELGNFMGLGAGAAGGFGGRRGGSGQQAQAWEEALKGKSVFPMRVVSYDQANKETNRLEVTAVEKQSIPDSEFAPPAGWRKFDMGEMMKGLMPGH